MIVVFVIDTSPSMGEPVNSSPNAVESSDSNAASPSGMSRLDLAKMAVESLTKLLDRRVHEHNQKLHHMQHKQQSNVSPGNTTITNHNNIGLGYAQPDQFLLLSTGRQTQYPSSSACGAGGRLLVGYHGTRIDPSSFQQQHQHQHQDNNNNHNQQADLLSYTENHGSFERELKRLRATDWKKNANASSKNQSHKPFPEDGGGAVGLNSALSSGLQLLSRYRLQNRLTENFGLGRLPSNAILTFVPTVLGIGSDAIGVGGGPNAVGGGANVPGSSTGSTTQFQLQQAGYALQPACLVLLTDGECLRRPIDEGGGPLQLQFGNMPLREFYREPFRWDQRIFCLGVGTSSDQLHPSLRAFCEVTGGCHAPLSSASAIPQVSEMLLRHISPPRPKHMPIPNPLRLPSLGPPTNNKDYLNNVASDGVFVNGGPVFSFQQLEMSVPGEVPPIHRAMLLYVPYQQDVLAKNSNNTNNINQLYQPPLWCVPESFFPSKKLDTLPPRTAQPLLSYSVHYQAVVGSNTFDPLQVMKELHRLDQLIVSNRSLISGGKQTEKHGLAIKLLQRDVYVCEWQSQDGKKLTSATAAQLPFPTQRGHEHFPVSVRGAGRNSLSDGAAENALNIGILHVPCRRMTLAAQQHLHPQQQQGNVAHLSTLTLLPPEPHILMNLLVRAAEAEHRVLKKAELNKKQQQQGGKLSSDGAPGLSTTSINTPPINVHLDENWRSEFRAYLFRIPPYYQHILRRSLRPILPSTVHSLLSTDGVESIASQCFSRLCLQKIRTGEQFAKDNNERLERREEELRRGGLALCAPDQHDSGGEVGGMPVIGYGQYDTRASTTSYLAALRNMPPPWRVGAAVAKSRRERFFRGFDVNDDDRAKRTKSALDCLGDLPHECLLAYYESRRRWIFGGSGLTTRGLSVEGVNNDGTNSHQYNLDHSAKDEYLLSVAEVGASTLNQTTISKMGDFRERLLWSRQPVVGYGCNDSTGSATTTAADGSPVWSVDNDALPLNFFDSKTGEFSDSVQTRVRARLMINFGNPYKDKRGDSLVPDDFVHQRPPLTQEGLDTEGGPLTPPGSPPHESFPAPMEGEGEAVFAGRPPSPSRRSESDNALNDIPRKRNSNSLPEAHQKAKKINRTTVKASTEERIKADKKTVNKNPPTPQKSPLQGDHGKAPPVPKRPLKGSTIPQKTKEQLKQKKAPPPPPPSRRHPPAGKPAPPPPPRQQLKGGPDQSKLKPTPRGKRQTSKEMQSSQPDDVSIPPPPLPPQAKSKDRKETTVEVTKEQPTSSLHSQKHKIKPKPTPPLPGKPAPPPPQQQTMKGAPDPQKLRPPPPTKQQQLQSTTVDQNPHKAQPPPPSDAHSPNIKPNVALPPGWMSVWSKSQKRWYFFDKKTNKSVWQWPPPGR